MSVTNLGQYPDVRLRRLRRTPALRKLIRQTLLTPNDLVSPLFIKEGRNIKTPISSMPSHFQLSIDQLKDEIKTLTSLNIPGVILFGIPEKKDSVASGSYAPNSVICDAIKTIKDIAPDLLVITDLCCCEYTDHGHCGVIHQKGNVWDVDNDPTLEILARQAVAHAEVGADLVAPSGMMDGQIQAIRKGLDQSNFSDIPILSYAVKYCSTFYGPFREAAEGAPKFGDRKTYQIDPANADEALREAALDLKEGADLLMVKPAQTYLDIIYQIKQAFPGVPLGAYHVSGEFSAIMAAGEKGWLDPIATGLEVLTSIKRSGADFIINYFNKLIVPKLI